MSFAIPESTFTEREQALIERDNLYLARVLACHRLREQGLSLRAIGTALGLSHERVRQLLRESAL